MTPPLRRLPAAALALGLFLAIWGAKLVVIDRCGTDLPFWDQWAKEGEVFLAPYLERGELWKNLFVPHNEHRIAPTLGLNLVLLVAGGQWDARVQCIASGAVHAVVLAGFFFWAARRMSRGGALALAVLVALIGGAPVAWENLLSGFQSQFYFLAGFSLLAIGGVLLSRAFSPGWWGGMAAGAAALVSMGSGVLCAPPIAAVAVLRLGQNGSARAARRDAIAALAAAAALGGAGAWLHTPTPWHDTLHAKSAWDLVVYAARCLAWPWVWWPWLAVVFWAPWTVLAWKRVALRDNAGGRAADFLLAGGLWVLAQAAAAAYSRGGGGGLPASRYGDLFGLGLAISGAALVLLVPERRRGWMMSGAWFAIAAVFLVLAGRESWRGPLHDKKAEHATYERNVQAFVLTDDYATFEKQKLPFPLPDWLARVLRRPSIRAVLPASVRGPIAANGWDTNATTPLLAPLAHRTTRTVVGPSEWRSPPLPGGRGWWKIETAGHVGQPGATLELVDAASGRTLAAIAPSKPAGNAWRAAYVPAPRVPAVLVARVGEASQWIAFSQPVAMSAWSYRAWQLGKYGAWIALAGVLGLLAAGIAAARKTPGDFAGAEPRTNRGRS